MCSQLYIQIQDKDHEVRFLCVMTHANVLYSNFKYSNVHKITTQIYISTHHECKVHWDFLKGKDGFSPQVQGSLEGKKRWL